MHGWMLPFDPARCASDFKCDSTGKINNSEGEWLRRLSITSIRRGGGTMCLRASLELRTIPEQIESISRASVVRAPHDL